VRKGFAEAYMSGELECNDLVALVSIYISNWTVLGNGSRFLSLLPRLQHLFTSIFRPNNTKNSLINASSHYDTSNELFTAFLSRDMSYSCPIWESREDTLEDAQLRKVRNVIDKAEIKSHHHVLDIGGGWCFLAIEAVKRTGCMVTATTLSVEQKALGEKKIKEEGLEDRIRVLLVDYRDTPLLEEGKKRYDRVVSVEMLEHVGKEFMNEFFGAIDQLLDPEEGVMVIQGITIINPVCLPLSFSLTSSNLTILLMDVRKQN
jgi:cyclopropane-fatty-acyl-phospholipid synthase